MTVGLYSIFPRKNQGQPTMIREALQYLSSQAQAAITPTMMADNTAEKVWVINGQLVTVPKSHPDRNHRLEIIADLVDMANRQAKDNPSNRVRIWYNRKQIKAIFDDEAYRANTASVTLNFSEQFQAVINLQTNVYDWKGMMRILSHDLRSAIAPAILLDKIRAVTFEGRQQSNGTKTRTGESIGKSINNEVAAVSDLPDEVVLNTTIYSNPTLGDRYAVKCNFEIDPTTQSFILKPQADEISRAVQMAILTTGDAIRLTLDDAIEVYQGDA